MNRRAFLTTVVGCVLAAPGEASAQAARRVYRLGVLSGGWAPIDNIVSSAAQVSALLRELGYVEGENLRIERKYAEGNAQALQRLARELVRSEVDVIHAIGTGPVQAAKGATTTIPIVFLSNFDPVAAGLVQSLARPGANVTGILIAPEGSLAGKKLELLKELVPRATRVALLVPDDSGAGVQQQILEVRNAATALSVELPLVVVRGREYANAFSAIAAGGAQALVVGAHSFFVRDQKAIIELAAKHRLPAIYEWPQQVRNGGLMSYGADEAEVYRQVAVYIDRVFRGAPPSDLPVWQPEKLHIVINLKTAKALGLAVPSSLLLRADTLFR